MTGMNDPRDLLLHELGDILYAENQLVKALPKMASEATDEQLRAGFEQHLEGTKGALLSLAWVAEVRGPAFRRRLRAVRTCSGIARSGSARPPGRRVVTATACHC